MPDILHGDEGIANRFLNCQSILKLPSGMELPSGVYGYLPTDKVAPPVEIDPRAREFLIKESTYSVAERGQ